MTSLEEVMIAIIIIELVVIVAFVFKDNDYFI